MGKLYTCRASFLCLALLFIKVNLSFINSYYWFGLAGWEQGRCFKSCRRSSAEGSDCGEFQEKWGIVANSLWDICRPWHRVWLPHEKLSAMRSSEWKRPPKSEFSATSQTLEVLLAVTAPRLVYQLEFYNAMGSLLNIPGLVYTLEFKFKLNLNFPSLLQRHPFPS